MVDLSVEYGDMVDPLKESNKHGSGHCTKMQAILRRTSHILRNETFTQFVRANCNNEWS